MSFPASVSVQSARLSQMGINHQLLKEGSSVLVRVIGDRGGGKYEGSVAGVRVQLSSSKALRPGDTFVGSLGIKNGTIVITPKNLTGEIALNFNEVSQNQLFSFLESLGLPADNISASILQSFKQMNLKMDSVLANKIRNLALRFAGKEKSAAEILTLLAQKGLEADDEEINELLALLQGNEARAADEAFQHQKNSKEDKKSKNKLINRINSKNGAWYLLPFELIQLGEVQQVLGRGIIRLLYDSSKALKLLKLDCNYNNRDYLFSLFYEGKKLKNTYFNISGDMVSDSPQIYQTKLKKAFLAAGLNAGQIQWAEKEALEGNSSGLESFIAFGGQV